MRKLKKRRLEEFPLQIQESILVGLDDMKKGKVIPHNEVKKKYQKWLRK